MRMRPPGDERGAVLLIVAISILVLLGMLVLTVDLGWLVANRRRMVQTSDSAALAAAQACAGQEAVVGGPAVAEPRADQYALQNDGAVNAGAANIIEMENCGALSGSGFVRVRYEREHRLLFAPIFGWSSSTVATVATATWEPAGGANTPIPIRLNFGTVLPCVTGGIGTRCSFGFDNTSEQTESQSQWGWLNFPQGWNQPECPGQTGGANDLADYIRGSGSAFEANLNDPPPTYACAFKGEAASAVQQLRNRIGALLTFPVMDTDNYPILVSSNNTQAYPIIGFTVLKVVGAWWGQQARQHCPWLAGQDSSVYCIELEWAGPQTGGTIPTPGDEVPDLGLRAIRLTE